MIINGEKVERDPTSVSDLLKAYELKKEHVVIEVDEHIIEKASYDSTILDSSSRIEIIAFVGGG